MKGAIPVDTMQQRQKRSISGAKAIVLDEKMICAHYRLSILLSVLGSAAFALLLQLILKLS
jgi:hypothetical protein